MTDKETILAEIERLKHYGNIPYDRDMFEGVCLIESFINSLPAEQPSKELEEASKSYADNEEYGNDAYFAIKMAFKAGANWQKEQDKALIERAEDHAKLGGMALGEKEAKEKFINKACEWLKENIYNRVYKCNDGLGFSTATFLEEFRKAMEESNK